MLALGLDERLNFMASIWAVITGFGFIVLYALMAPGWRRSYVGRALMTLVGSITLLCVNVIVHYALGIDLYWIRLVRAFLVAVTGTMILFLAVTVVRVQTERDTDDQ